MYADAKQQTGKNGCGIQYLEKEEIRWMRTRLLMTRLSICLMKYGN